MIAGTRVHPILKTKYLGHMLTTDGRQNLDAERARKAIYAAYHMAMRPCKAASTQAKMRIFKAHCGHLFGCDTWTEVSASTLRQVEIAYNNCLKTTLNLSKYASTTLAAMEADCLPFSFVFIKRRLSYHLRLSYSTNLCVRAILRVRSSRLRTARRQDLDTIGAMNWLPPEHFTSAKAELRRMVDSCFVRTCAAKCEELNADAIMLEIINEDNVD